MSVTKGSNGKWKIGSGRSMYKTKGAADKAYRAMLAHQKRKK